jgi:hypothetical protein
MRAALRGRGVEEDRSAVRVLYLEVLASVLAGDHAVLQVHAALREDLRDRADVPAPEVDRVDRDHALEQREAGGDHALAILDRVVDAAEDRPALLGVAAREHHAQLPVESHCGLEVVAGETPGQVAEVHPRAGVDVVLGDRDRERVPARVPLGLLGARVEEHVPAVGIDVGEARRALIALDLEPARAHRRADRAEVGAAEVRQVPVDVAVEQVDLDRPVPEHRPALLHVATELNEVELRVEVERGLEVLHGEAWHEPAQRRVFGRVDRRHGASSRIRGRPS